MQFDIDHLAKPQYLHKTLGHFRDERVAWVQSPSVYKNTEHWTARGAAEQELVLQGPLQMGFYGHSQTPFIIGSHCVYRMSAVREIGGFQPTRAEDHLDTVLLSNHGYRGVFVPEIIAEGDGPETLTTYLAQQFAWAYSMFQVLIFHSPKLLPGMPRRRKLQFLFAQTWYPLWSLGYFVMFLAPIVSLLVNHNTAHMNGDDFVFHFAPMFICSFLVWWAARPLMQPSHVHLSWRGMILHAVRWPIVFRAVLAAAFRITKPYMITPKGEFAQLAPTVKLYRPFLLLGTASSLAVIIASLLYGSATLEGQTVFALTNALFMLIICFVDLDLGLRKATDKLADFRQYWLKPASAVMALAVLFNLTLAVSPLIQDQVYAIIGSPKTASLSSPLIPASDMSTSSLISAINQLPARPNSQTPAVGIFNPSRQLPASQSYIEHSFVDWQDTHELAKQIYLSEQANDTALVTLQPGGEADGSKLLSDIADGRYDQRLNSIAQILRASHRPVYIRFAHEMELYDVYPWGNQDPALYIAAWRHVVTHVKAQGATNVKWVWSPAGNNGAEAYYPGDEYVDIVGTTILYDRYWYGAYHPSFYELQVNRSWLQQYGKPVWITEFGAGTYDAAFQKQLIQQALGEYKQDGYSALVYLNIADANITGPDYRLHGFSAFGNLFTAPTPAAPAAPQSTKHAPSTPPTRGTNKPILPLFKPAEQL